MEALEGIRMPCRQEVLRRHPLRMLDGAHNPHGIRALTETLLTVPEEERVPLTLLWGMLRDKDVRACVSPARPSGGTGGVLCPGQSTGHAGGGARRPFP